MINVTDFTVDGKCSSCGNCCGNFLPISGREIKEIKRYIKKHRIPEQIRVFPETGVSIDCTCPFRSEVEKKCLIYPIRPEICRVFQCNQSTDVIRKNKSLLNHKYYTVDMRSVFYGHEDGVRDMLMRIHKVTNGEVK